MVNFSSAKFYSAKVHEIETKWNSFGNMLEIQIFAI